MAPPPGDPMGLQDPVLAMLDPLSDPSFLNMILDEVQPSDDKPKYPKWYKKPKKPSKQTILDLARKMESEFRGSGLRERYQRDISLLRGDLRGVFPDFVPGIETEFPSTALIDEHNLMRALLSAIEPDFESVDRQGANPAEATDKNDFVYALFRQWERDHARAGDGVLRGDLPNDLLTYGRFVIRTMCDPEADEGTIPLKVTLFDPAICHPLRDGARGLKAMVLIYRDTVANVVGNFDRDGKLEKRLLEDDRGDDGRFRAKLEWDQEVEVIEYYDRAWRAVFVDEEDAINVVAHDYGFVPFIDQLSAMGEPGHTKTPGNRDSNTTPSGYANRRRLSSDAESKGVAHHHFRVGSHQIYESMLSRLMTEFQKAANPPMIWTSTPNSKGEGVPQTSPAPGAVSEIEQGERLEIFPSIPSNSVTGPLMQALGTDRLTGSSPLSDYGANDKSNVSGSAVQGLSENSRYRMTPHLLSIQMGLGRWADQALTLFRDWGNLYGEENQRGMYMVPRKDPRPGQEKMFLITPDAIKRSGVQMECLMTDLPMSQLGPLGNAQSLWRSTGAMSRKEAIRMRGARNPDQVIEDIEIEEMQQDPLVKDLRLYKTLMARGEDQIAAVVLDRIVTGRSQQMQQQQGGGGPPGGGPPSPAGAPGLSLPGLGMPPGADGGRPPGMMGGEMTMIPGPPPAPGNFG